MQNASPDTPGCPRIDDHPSEGSASHEERQRAHDAARAWSVRPMQVSLLLAVQAQQGAGASHSLAYELGYRQGWRDAHTEEW